MGIGIKAPEINWADWARAYNERRDAERAAMEGAVDETLQGLGLTATGWMRARQDDEWNRYVRANPDASFEDMYRQRLRIYGGI